tara:strand:+ start:247 stop:1053 length:807 start_codon:yes stop_codon:yes gene_type:complete
LKILIADGYNLLYRARTGWGKGDNPIVFNFIRSFKALVEKFEPDKTYFVLEGKPKKRKDLLPEYKAQRVYSDHDDFYRQKSLCIDFVKTWLPVEVIRHEDHECDDVVGYLATNRHSSDDCVVISSDTDFIQLLSTDDDRVKLYNPVRKKFIEAPAYDYVGWKALTGDKSDNIPGFHKVGPKTAEKLITDDQKLNEFLSVDDRLTRYEKNVELIRFENVDEDKLEAVCGSYDSQAIRDIFESMNFDSMLNERYWNNFERVFSNGTKHAG